MYVNYFFINFTYKSKVSQCLCTNSLQFFLNINILKKYYFLYVTYTRA